MRFLFIVLLSVALPGTARAQKGSSVEERAFFELGRELSLQFRFQPEEQVRVLEGMEDARSGRASAVPLSTFGRLHWTATVRYTASHRKEDGARALEYGAMEPGAIQTPSGLIFTPVEGGRGRPPRDGDRVKVYYSAAWGRTAAPFETLHDRNSRNPVEFDLAELIPCWREALQRMKPGGRAYVLCPSELAHGDDGRPSPSPEKPHGSELYGEVLRYKIELLEVSTPREDVAQTAAAESLLRRRDAALRAASYALGFALARSMVFEEHHVKAFREGLSQRPGGDPLEPHDHAPHQRVLSERRKLAAKAHQKEAAHFIARMAREKDAERTMSGAVFIPGKEGSGALLSSNDALRFSARGTLPDGTEVVNDSSGEFIPSRRLGNLEPCLREGFARMKPGGSARYICPSREDPSKYTDPVPPRVPFGAVVHYELELLGIQDPAVW